jgi:hypothetical protein
MPKKYSLILFCLALLVMFSTEPAVGKTEEPSVPGRVFRYKISSHGLGVGELKTAISPVQHGGKRTLRFESDLAIDAHLIFFKKTSRSKEEALVSEQGTLSYRKRGEENGKGYSIDAALDGGSFHFRIAENGAVRNIAVARGSYDYTTMDCPETSMKREGESLEVRLLDMGLATVVTRRFHFLKNEDMQVGGRTIRCKVVEFSDPNNSCRRWLSSDERGVIIVRQDGKGKGGSYSLRLVSLSDSAD